MMQRERLAVKKDVPERRMERYLCVKHGAKMKRCSHEGCTNQARNGGVCSDMVQLRRAIPSYTHAEWIAIHGFAS